MNHSIELVVKLKVTDNEARSALEALQVKMGLGDAVSGLARDDVWELSVEADDEAAAIELIGDLVSATNLFANPNKHRTAVGRPGATGDPLGDDEIAVLVAERGSDEGAAILRTLEGLGHGDVVDARRWTRWRVRLAEMPGHDDPDLLARVRHIAVTTGRAEGLLSNPHCEVSRVVFPWGGEAWLER
ncbi:MAG: hypothetical protein GF405_06165 [Candidatus Eisenbacteria bacterium]|nr:hypothetical protein [Candidatus Eisenbacteria bacterium]